MKPATSTAIAAFYGFCVIASGLVRYIERPDGEKGLWFGLIMGGIAWIAAVGFALNRKVVGQILVSTSLVFVGSWFIYEALIKKGLYQAEPRQLIIILVTLGVAGCFLVNFRTTKATDNQIEKKHP